MNEYRDAVAGHTRGSAIEPDVAVVVCAHTYYADLMDLHAFVFLLPDTGQRFTLYSKAAHASWESGTRSRRALHRYILTAGGGDQKHKQAQRRRWR